MEAGVQVTPREPGTGNIGNCGGIRPQGSPGSLGTKGLLAGSEGSCAIAEQRSLRAQVGGVGPLARPVGGLGAGGAVGNLKGVPVGSFDFFRDPRRWWEARLA